MIKKLALISVFSLAFTSVISMESAYANCKNDLKTKFPACTQGCTNVKNECIKNCHDCKKKCKAYKSPASCKAGCENVCGTKEINCTDLANTCQTGCNNYKSGLTNSKCHSC